MIVSHVITAAIIMTIDKETVSIAVIIVIPTLYTYSSTSEPPTHPSHHSLLAGEPWILLKLDINSSTMEKSSKIDPACLRNTSTITSHVSNDWNHGAPSFWSLAQGCSPAQKNEKSGDQSGWQTLSGDPSKPKMTCDRRSTQLLGRVSNSRRSLSW